MSAGLAPELTISTNSLADAPMTPVMNSFTRTSALPGGGGGGGGGADRPGMPRCVPGLLRGQRMRPQAHRETRRDPATALGIARDQYADALPLEWLTRPDEPRSSTVPEQEIRPLECRRSNSLGRACVQAERRVA